MKMKAKSYTHTHTRTRCLQSFTRSVSGAHLFRKAKRGLSVSLTLEVKWAFKWRPLAGGHICPVTNFTPPSSPDDFPAWPHPGNLRLAFAWTERGEGRVFRLTKKTCSRSRSQGLITIAIKRKRIFVSCFWACSWCKCVPAPKIFTLRSNHPRTSLLTWEDVVTTALVPPFTAYLCSVSIHAPPWPVWLLLTCTQLSGDGTRFI